MNDIGRKRRRAVTEWEHENQMQTSNGSYAKQMNSKKMSLRQPQKGEYGLSMRQFKELLLILLDFIMA